MKSKLKRKKLHRNYSCVVIDYSTNSTQTRKEWEISAENLTQAQGIVSRETGASKDARATHWDHHKSLNFYTRFFDVNPDNTQKQFKQIILKEIL